MTEQHDIHPNATEADLEHSINDALELRDYATAFHLARPLADQGYDFAQNILGYMYATGEGVPQDTAEAMRWYRKAADQGNDDADNNVGIMYRDGCDVRHDYAVAYWCFILSDQPVSAHVHTTVGDMYYSGRGLPRDGREAMRRFRKAADRRLRESVKWFRYYVANRTRFFRAAPRQWPGTWPIYAMK